MEENKIFRFIWRLNAVVILTAGVLAVAGLILSGIFIVRDITQHNYVEGTVNTEEDSDMVEEWVLGSFEPVAGTPAVVASLVSDQAYAQGYFEKETYSTRNLLFINTRSNAKRWLLQTNDHLVVDYHHLTETDRQQTEEAKGFVYVIVKTDTNDDKRLSDDDLKTVSASRPDGSHLTELVDGVDELIDYTLLDDAIVLISYWKGGDIYTGYIDLETMEFDRVSKVF